MAIPICEQIVLLVKQRIQVIDTQIGYETTVNGTVVRPTRLWQGNSKDYQVLVIQGVNEYNDTMSHPGNPPAIAWDLNLSIIGELRPSEDNAEPIDSLCNEFASDIIKSICTPSESWHNWNSLAINSEIKNIEHYNSEEASGTKIELVITYRVSENDPYTTRT